MVCLACAAEQADVGGDAFLHLVELGLDRLQGIILAVVRVVVADEAVDEGVLDLGGDIYGSSGFSVLR